MNRLALIALVFLFSCKTQQLPVSPVVLPPVKAEPVLFSADSLLKNAFQFETFSARAKVEVDDAGNKTEFTASIRVRNDSVVWISISPALGLEAVRILMTPDSVKVIDRLKKEHYAADYGYFSKYTSLPVSLQVMQDLLEGNPLYLRTEYRAQMLDSMIVLTFYGDSVFDSLTVTRDFRLQQQVLEDRRGGKLVTENSRYDIQYNPPFSLWRRITVFRKSEMFIGITFSRIKLNEPLTFPF